MLRREHMKSIMKIYTIMLLILLLLTGCSRSKEAVNQASTEKSLEESTDTTEPVKGTESVVSTEAAGDSEHAVESEPTDRTEPAESTEFAGSTEKTDSTETAESTEAAERTETADSTEGAESAEGTDSSKSTEAADKSETTGATDSSSGFSTGQIPPVITISAQRLDISVLPGTARDVVFAGVAEDRALQIDEILDGFDKEISLAVYSIDGSKSLFYNTEQRFFSACTIKIPWIMYLCKGIDAGVYDKDMELTYEERHYHQGSGNIRKGEYGDTYTVEKLIKLCLSISDNVAYKMLMELVNTEDYIRYTNELGYATFQTKGKMWSSRAMVKDYLGVWNEAYQYMATGTEGAKLMKNSCTNTPFAYGVLTLEDSSYSHKSGDNFGASCAYHDAGIVWANTPYMYAVFSKCEGEDVYTEKIDSAMAIVHELFGGNMEDER